MGVSVLDGVSVIVAVSVVVGVSLGTAVPTLSGTKRTASAANSRPDTVVDWSWVLFPS